MREESCFKKKLHLSIICNYISIKCVQCDTGVLTCNIEASFSELCIPDTLLKGGSYYLIITLTCLVAIQNNLFNCIKSRGVSIF